jgi:hypothetical protein
MLNRHNERRLRYPFEQDKRLVIALRQGPVKITKELLDTVRSANSFGLMEIAQEHMARRTQNAEFTRAFLERMFSPELQEPERGFLAHNVHKYLRFPENLVAEIATPHLDPSDPMSAAAMVFVDKATQLRDAPVVDWDRILPEDDLSSRMGHPPPPQWIPPVLEKSPRRSQIRVHSLRRASITSSFSAFMAGMIPLRMPTPTIEIKETAIAVQSKTHSNFRVLMTWLAP